MIRQLGPATLFCSFSSAETQWVHLLRILAQLVDNTTYTDEQIENFNWEDRCCLIQSDPVTCARHFDYQVNQFLTHFLLSSSEPLGKISDWFYRVEYQQRGSPHIHMLIWIKDAPQFQTDSDKEVTTFIDKIITCIKPIDNPELLKLVNRQVHRHLHTCRKNTSNPCRFNYSQPPMKQTMILYPFNEKTPNSDINTYKESWKSIKSYLDNLQNCEDMRFEDLLLKLNITEENYLLAIRSSLNSATIFLKRNPNEIHTNYNADCNCLTAWREKIWIYSMY